MKDIALAIIAIALCFALGYCMAETWMNDCENYVCDWSKK